MHGHPSGQSGGWPLGHGGCIGVWNAREASRIVDGSIHMFVDGVDDFGGGRHVGAALKEKKIGQNGGQLLANSGC